MTELKVLGTWPNVNVQAVEEGHLDRDVLTGTRCVRIHLDVPIDDLDEEKWNTLRKDVRERRWQSVYRTIMDDEDLPKSGEWQRALAVLKAALGEPSA